MMQNCQDINVEENGISFAEEGFTQMYDEAVKVNEKYMSDINLATGKGILIGAAGVGLVWLGKKGVDKLKERKLKVSMTIGEIGEVLEKQSFKDIKVKEDEKVVKTISKEKSDELTEIIEAITENEKSVKH